LNFVRYLTKKSSAIKKMAEKQSNEEENRQINENKEQEKELVIDIDNYIKYVPLLLLH